MEVPIPPERQQLLQTIRDAAETTKVVVEVLWWVIRLVNLLP